MQQNRRKVYHRRPSLTKRSSGIYYIHHQNRGTQIRLSTKTRKRVEAESALDQYLSQLQENRPTPAMTLTLKSGIDEWYEDRSSPRQNLSDKTLAGYKSLAKKIKKVMPPRLLCQDVTRADIRKSLDALPNSGESDIQVAKCRTILSQVCNFLVAEGICTSCAGKFRRKNPRPEKRGFFSAICAQRMVSEIVFSIAPDPRSAPWNQMFIPTIPKC